LEVPAFAGMTEKGSLVRLHSGTPIARDDRGLDEGRMTVAGYRLSAIRFSMIKKKFPLYGRFFNEKIP